MSDKPIHLNANPLLCPLPFIPTTNRHLHYICISFKSRSTITLGAKREDGGEGYFTLQGNCCITSLNINTLNLPLGSRGYYHSQKNINELFLCLSALKHAAEGCDGLSPTTYPEASGRITPSTTCLYLMDRIVLLAHSKSRRSS